MSEKAAFVTELLDRRAKRGIIASQEQPDTMKT